MRITTIHWRALASTAIIAGLAACSDNPTQPATPATAPRAQSTLVQVPNVPVVATTATLRVKDIWGALIPDGVHTEWIMADGTSKVIHDNIGPDLDPTWGVITVKMPYSPTIKVCLYTDASMHAIDTTKPYCNTVAWSYPTMDMGTLVMRRNPWMTFYTVDMNGKLLPGATITVTGPIAFNEQVVDGGVWDHFSPVDGKLNVKLDRPGTYTWCENVAPVGYLLTNPTCGTFQAYWDVDMAMQVKHAPIAIKLPG